MRDPNSAAPQASTPSSSTVPTVEERRHKLEVGRDHALARFAERLGGANAAPLYAGHTTHVDRILSALREYVGASRQAGFFEMAMVGVPNGEKRQMRMSWLSHACSERTRARLRLHFELAEHGGPSLPRVMEMEQLADKAAKREHMLAVLTNKVLDELPFERRELFEARVDAEIAGELS